MRKNLWWIAGLLLATPASGQNTMTPNATDLIQLTSPLRTNPSVAYATPSGIVATGLLTSQNLGVATGTSLAIGGATIGSNALAVTGTVLLNSALSPGGGIAAADGSTVSPRNVWGCGVSYSGATSAHTAQTPVNTEVYINEVTVPSNMTVTGVTMFNSATISGNVKVGLANSAGAVVATSASVAQSGTSTIQLVPFTGTYPAVGPATYYILTFFDNNTTRPWTVTLGSCGAAKQTGQTYATGFTTITPPTTFTTALGTIAALY